MAKEKKVRTVRKPKPVRLPSVIQTQLPVDMFDGVAGMAAAERTTLSHITRRAIMIYLLQNGWKPAPMVSPTAQQPVAV